MENSTRYAFVTIVGKPNVGKSSLLNVLAGEKIAIISNKPQTTRTKITGVLTKDNIQYVFTDTPGLHKPKNKLSEYMVNQVNDSFADIDIVLFVTDMANEIFKSELELIDNFKKMNVPVILVINKIDTQDDKTKIISRIKDFSDLYDFDAVIPMSVLENDGVDIVFSELEKRTIEGPHFFPDDTLTDQPERVIVAEIIREKVLNLMRDEIPHGTAVVIDKMKDRENSSIVDIDATIICERQSHKGMIIGKGGAMLKKIGTLAREEIETFLDTKVFLNIWVKVSEDWRKKEKIIKDFGFN